LAAFNALPGGVTGDWWAHQYMSQANQPVATNLSSTPFYNTNSTGQTYVRTKDTTVTGLPLTHRPQGLEPNYPCCTVNHPQGLPKFLQSVFVTSGNNSILHALLSPAVVTTTLRSGATVTVDCQTNNPFEDTLFYDVTSDRAFDLDVRVPEWAESAALMSHHAHGNKVAGGLMRISLPQGISRVMYTLNTGIRTTPRVNDTIAVYHGQLLYAYEIGAHITSTSPHVYNTQQLHPEGYAPLQSRDYSMVNTTDWNVAIDPSTLEYKHKSPINYTINSTPQAMPGPMFASGAPPNFLTAKACLIDWPLLVEGSVPSGPPTGEARKCLGKAFDIKLVPYGSAKLRMAELPTIDLGR
jgi:hypothetical protein